MPQILVVDDVPAMAGQYAYDLKRMAGYDTIVAGGGDEALDIIGREPVDCVVLDLEMPGTDGFEVLRRLRRHQDDNNYGTAFPRGAPLFEHRACGSAGFGPSTTTR